MGKTESPEAQVRSCVRNRTQNVFDGVDSLKGKETKAIKNSHGRWSVCKLKGKKNLMNHNVAEFVNFTVGTMFATVVFV